MSNLEHYFENLLYSGKDVNGDMNKNSLTKEEQNAVEICADYVLYTLFHGRDDMKEVLESREVDAEPVVRCKDCRFYEISELKKDYTEDKRCKPSVCVKGYYAKPRKGSWYCADGVRRDEVKE